MRKRSRSRISLRMRAAISFCLAFSAAGSSVNHSSALRIDRSDDLADVQAGDLHRQRLRLQAIAVAGRAGGGRHEALDLLAHPCRFRLLPAPLEIGDHALEGLGRLVGAQPVVIVERDLALAGAVQDRLLGLVGQVPELVAELEAVGLAERLQRLRVIGRGGLRPRADGAVAQRAVLVGHDQVGRRWRAGCRGRRRSGRRRTGC